MPFFTSILMTNYKMLKSWKLIKMKRHMNNTVHDYLLDEFKGICIEAITFTFRFKLHVSSICMIKGTLTALDIIPFKPKLECLNSYYICREILYNIWKSVNNWKKVRVISRNYHSDICIENQLFEKPWTIKLSKGDVHNCKFLSIYILLSCTFGFFFSFFHYYYGSYSSLAFIKNRLWPLNVLEKSKMCSGRPQIMSYAIFTIIEEIQFSIHGKA